MDRNLPKRIFEESNERYVDEETGYFVAIMTVDLYNKSRDVMIAYTVEQDFAKLLTIHPLKERQKDNRVKSGRWRKIQ